MKVVIFLILGLNLSLYSQVPGSSKKEEENKPASCEQAYATRYYTKIRQILTTKKGCRATFDLNNAQKKALAGLDSCKNMKKLDTDPGPTFNELVHDLVLKSKKNVAKDKCSQAAFAEEKKSIGKEALKLINDRRANLAAEACKMVRDNLETIKASVDKTFDACATKELEAKNKGKCELGEVEFCTNPKAVLDKTAKAVPTTTEKEKTTADSANSKVEKAEDPKKDQAAEKGNEESSASGSGASSI
jgi:hypothetical protein